jgi:hypothetical protein
MRILIAGWFSFEKMGATAGDIIARDLVCGWLKETSIAYDIALAATFEGGIDWKKTDPKSYTDVVFVCGPFGNGWPVTEFVDHFSGCRLIGINLSMLQSPEEWNPFEILFERDSVLVTRPDITFLGTPPAIPVVGVILAHKQLEYGKNSLHEKANEAIRNLLLKKEAAVVMIDTALEKNQGGLKTHGEVEALIARMDLVLTTRLHGTVLALKNGVPVIPIDPIAGGAKISLQVKTLNWPVLFKAAFLDENKLSEAFNYCLTRTAKNKAMECAEVAVKKIEALKESFLTQLLCLPEKKYAYGN